MKKARIASAMAAAVAIAAGAPGHASNLPAGTLITGTASGATTGLLGLDAGFADVPGSNITALAAADLEFLSKDFAVGIDFLTNGSVLFYDNTGLGTLAGDYTFTFDFAGLSNAISGFTLSDVSSVTAGSLSAVALNGHAVRITLHDLSFSTPFAAFTAQVATVPEPGTLALLGASLALLGATRRKAAVCARREGKHIP